MPDPIASVIDARAADPRRGPVEAIARAYAPDSRRLLGFLLDMGYEEATLLTSDAWKRNCGGVPRNSFLLIKLSEGVGFDEEANTRLILARVRDVAATPIKAEIEQTLFQVHRLQAALDPMTNTDLQWNALRVSVIGTFYDEGGTIAFGTDIDTFLSAHFYAAYVPEDVHLECLINSFVPETNAFEFGRLRYTETLPRDGGPQVAVRVSADDFIGVGNGNRTALFGKTRFGKSNTIKVIADAIMFCGRNVGQVIFDPSGEYSYVNDQDRTSLYVMHQDRCVRYSLNPKNPLDESRLNLPPPTLMKANFHDQIALGHQVITSLWDAENQSRPLYLREFLAWEPCDDRDIRNRFPEPGDQVRARRSNAFYRAMLSRAGMAAPAGRTVDLHLNQAIRRALAGVPALAGVGMAAAGEISGTQTVGNAALVLEHLFELHRAQGNAALFPPSQRTGKPYFDAVQVDLMKMIGDRSVNGLGYIRPFRRYHDPAGRQFLDEIIQAVDHGRTVIVDFANADEQIARYFSELICRRILSNQMTKFAEDRLGDHHMLLYFEEAHTLFRADDKDLNSIYNKLAKEGAKFRIGMVYATQSMTTLSPDLRKNTENFIIAHLSDDREITELTKRYEFRDVGPDVQRTQTRGYVRMITLSHRFALPVRVRRFEPRPVPVADQPAGSAAPPVRVRRRLAPAGNR